MTGDELRRAVLRGEDPLHDRRTEMPCHEFDAVDFFCNQQPGRGATPPATVQAYFDSGLSQPQLADRLDPIVGDMAATLAKTTPLALAPVAEWASSDGSAKADLWTAQTRDAVAADLRDERLDLLHITFMEGQEAQHRWFLTVWTSTRSGAALSMSLTSMDLWPADATDRAASEVLALVRGWARPLRLRTAGITYDRGTPSESPWEQWYACGHHITATLTTERLRGYYWANLLTTGHLTRLGGLEQLREHAERHGLTVEPATDHAGTDAVIVRAPGPITAFDDDVLAAAKHVLGPALVHHQYTMYLGYPLRIIPDPGTAFRKVPKGSPFPRLLDGRGPYADEVP